MFRTDPLLLLADVATIVAEHPHLDEALVRAIYQHQVLSSGEQPSLQEARLYLRHLTRRLEEDRLRAMLGLDAPTPPASRRRRAVATTAVVPGPQPPSVTRSPGRPGWNQALFWQRFAQAAQHAASPAAADVAQHFEMLDGAVGTDPEYVRKLLKRFGRPRTTGRNSTGRNWPQPE
jgi:hypothetical protein